jgi:hypothetical protein
VKRESRAQHPAPAMTSPLAKPATSDALVLYLTKYGDWGNRCMTAFGTYLWPLHIEHCAECRAVQEAWDAEKQRGAA